MSMRHGHGTGKPRDVARSSSPPLKRIVVTMTEKEGILRLQPSGCWAVCRPGRAPVEITSGEQFRIEVDGELKVARMELRILPGP